MRSNTKRARRRAALAFSICSALFGPSAMAATYYGPPYEVQSFRGVGTFESVGAGVSFLTEKILSPCRQNPQCTDPPKVTVKYGPNTHWAAASIFVNGKQTDTVTASEISIGQPEKNFGGCQQRCTSGLGSDNDATGARGTAKSAASANAMNPGSSFEGDPINAASGNFYRQETDFDASSSLTFRRFYNSSPRAPGSSLGPQWRHSFERRLEVLASSPEIVGAGAFVRVMRSDGASEIFTKKNGVWSADADVADVLVEQPAGAGYALQLAASRQTEIYDAVGLLKEVYDASGQRILVLEYSTSQTPAGVATAPGLLISVTDQRGRALSFSYNATSRLSSVVLPDSSEQTFSYNAGGYLASTTYPDGSSKGYIYNEAANTSSTNRPGFLTGITDENGKRYETIKYTSGSRAYYTEFAGGVDATTLEYATLTSNGTLPVTVKSTLGAQSLLKFSDTGKGRILPAGGSAACGTQCNQPYKSMTYDANGNPASTTDFKGVITRTTYTSDGLLSEQVDAAGTPQQVTTSTTWDAVLRVPLTNIVKDSAGTPVSSTAWTYNSLGLETSRCEVDTGVPSAASYACGTAANAPIGVRQWKSSYCTSIDSTQCPQVGLILSEDGPRTDVADVTRYSYYLTADESGCGAGGGNCHRAGDLYQVTNALGHASTWLSYDKNGRPTRMRNEVGTIHDLVYSPRGKLISTIERAQADGAASNLDRLTTIGLDPAENVVSVIDPDGVSLAYTYDDAHRLIKITDAAGNSIRYGLDAAGNRVKEEITDSSGSVKRSLSRVYDKLGQMTSQKTAGGDSTDFAYDLVGNVQLITDALKRKTQLEYDALGRLSSTLEDVTGLAVRTRYAYDAEGRTTAVTDPKGLTTSYQYSGLGDIIAQQSPDTGVSNATYGSAGQLATRVDADGRTVAFTFDALGRIARKVYGNQEIIATYAYDQVEPVCGVNESFAKGRLSSLQDDSGTTQYCYDQAGNVTRKVQASGGTSAAVQYSYTKGGRLRTMTYPDGTIVDYVRDAIGTVTEIGVIRAGVAREILISGANRHPFGPSSGWSYGNGRTLSREVDKDYRPLALRGGAGGLNSTYSFNAVGDLVGLGATDSGEPPVTLTYDSLGRLNALKDGTTGAVIDSYAYDLTGNRISARVNGVERTYVYPSNSHRLSSVAGAARSYDLAGNALSIGGGERDFSYNAANRMSAVRINGTLAAEFRYNEFGQQTGRSAQGDADRFVYNEQGQWLGSYDQTNTASQQVIWLDELPVGLIEGGSLQYVEPDHLGTPRAIVNPARDAVVWTWNLKGEAFGTTAPNEDPDLDGTKFDFSLRLPGQRYDASTGLSQNHFRDYDASSGRYIQSDPIGLAGSISTYGYVDGDPMSRIDPTGLDSIVTYQNLGRTVYYDDSGNFVKSWDSRSAVANSALAGAAGPYQSADVYPTRGPYKNNSTSFGPNDILKTDDTARGRWIHGGGTGLKDPRAPRQGWKPTMGCTRMQNEDIQELVDMVRDAKTKNPKKPIPYQRLNYQRPVIIPLF